ncbi:MAG: ATP-binding protein [Acidobacteria bacterium]|nr:ATP-binding protein [Acidobacteriota bacterium]
MALQTTPENVFVFYSLECILCGLLAFGLAWAFYKNRALRRKKRLVLLLGAIAVLGLAFFLCSSLGFYEFYFQERLFSDDPEDVAFVFFLIAALLLGTALTVPSSLRSLPSVIVIAGVVLGLADLLRRLTQMGRGPGSIHWIGLAIVLALFFVPLRSSQTPRGLLSLVLSGFVLSFLLFSRSASYSAHSYGVVLWAVQHISFVGSLIALAHVIELDTQDLFVKAFIRLNLTFVLLAGFVILLVTRVERQEYGEFAAREATDLMEFLRGHVMYFDSQGQNNRQILSNPEIARRIVSDFGKLPDLRSAVIHLDGHQLSMTISPEGAVTRVLEQQPVQAGSFRFESAIEGNTLALAMPIYRSKEITGWVKLVESLAMINRRIAHQIMIIFTAFTIVVIFSSILVGIIVTQADATIRKQYREIEETQKQLFQASKLAALGEMAGAVAHEINNPLGVILGRSDYLVAIAKLRNANEFAEDLEVIQRHASRTARILSELLDFARVHKLNRERHDINALLAETLELVESRLASQNLRVHKEFSPVPLAAVDWHQMQEVLVNLINNAIDASRAGGVIRLQTRYDSMRSAVEIAVEDDGIGIPAEHLKKIFDPFFTTKQRGTGLGLSVSYRIVRDHGGKISVESERGQGTRFVITLPAVETIAETDKTV